MNFKLRTDYIAKSRKFCLNFTPKPGTEYILLRIMIFYVKSGNCCGDDPLVFAPMVRERIAATLQR